MDFLMLSLRVDNNDDELLLKKMLATAIDFLIGKIGIDDGLFYESNNIFDTATIFMTDHLYRTRSATVDNITIINVPLNVNTMILDLKASYKANQNKKAGDYSGNN
ncbi:hypothetical protein EP04_01950 [Listeria monocytogenes]|uniref:Phage gp6-like head-tail connector protein n=2 Tax=Listeria innocua TaxID=1642 RepID=A0AB73HAB4_LISIO|nr:hypothetical protein [Listeria monocytogenes]EAG4505311.1 hypothetical protein [Listeria monocytogenes]MBC2142849.1 hypothetical protein [Listeria innocua]